jgi:hypothetical protein
MPIIPAIPARVRNYLFTFGSIAIALKARGVIVLTANPAGAEQAFWLKRTDGQRLLDECRVRGDIEAAARRLKIILTPHDLVMMKTDRALCQIDTILQMAQENGDLKRFNTLYKRKRLAALALGNRYMSYSTARQRLQRALVDAIADGSQGRPFTFVMHQVLEQ